MPPNAWKPENLRRALRRIAAFVREDLHAAEEEARDKAHLATVADRPFAGCQPCEPGYPDAMLGPTPSDNPVARKREL